MPAQFFSKAISTKPIVTSPKASPSPMGDYCGKKRFAKSEAETPQGMMRLADKVIADGLPQPPEVESKRVKEASYAEQRCRTIDPNAYRRRLPFNRVETPHEAPKRRPPGWTDCRFILPQLVLEGLRALSIELAHQQQNSDWPGERCRYPRTKNFHVTAALNDYLRRLGFGQFCVEEQKPVRRRVRRFVAPNP